MEFTLMVGIGDQLCATPIIREVKRRWPNENVRIFEPSRRDLWQGNPRLNVGNHENGVRIHLDSPAQGERIAEHYAARVARVLKCDFKLEDDTPEIFLTPEELSEGFGIPAGKNIAINSEAGWSTRQWPYFAELARMLLDNGWNVYHVGYDGMPALPCTRSFHNQLTVRQTAVLLKQIGKLVCNDTGLMHLAAAMGVPHVITFGFIKPQERVYSTTRFPKVDPCLKQCDYSQCIKSSRCASLDALPVRAVFSEVVR